jgi:hypothetical protein
MGRFGQNFLAILKKLLRHPEQRVMGLSLF